MLTELVVDFFKLQPKINSGDRCCCADQEARLLLILRFVMDR